MKHIFRILLKSGRFLFGFAVVLFVLAFAIFYPMINTNDPKENRFNNPNYVTMAPVREALEAGDLALAEAEAVKLSGTGDEELSKTVGATLDKIAEGDEKAALKAAKEIKKTIKREKDQPPTREFPLGTDNFATDMLLKLAYGARTSLFVGLEAGIIATLIGLIIGLCAGFIGGTTDNTLTTVTNMFIVIPSFVILILLSVALGSTPTWMTGIIIGVTSWPWTARAVRAQTTSLRNRDHVNMARITGYSTARIIVTEILPYIASYVVMAFILQMASGIMSEATLSLLGLGDPSSISLGKLLNWAMQFEAVRSARWWQFVPVAVTIALVTFSLYMMNSGMDEVFNPKIRS